MTRPPFSFFFCFFAGCGWGVCFVFVGLSLFFLCSLGGFFFLFCFCWGVVVFGFLWGFFFGGGWVFFFCGFFFLRKRRSFNSLFFGFFRGTYANPCSPVGRVSLRKKTSFGQNLLFTFCMILGSPHHPRRPVDPSYAFVLLLRVHCPFSFLFRIVNQ